LFEVKGFDLEESSNSFRFSSCLAGGLAGLAGMIRCRIKAKVQNTVSDFV
jgi:hypothetical protein